MAVTREEITVTARRLAEVLGYAGLQMRKAGMELEEFSRQFREVVEGQGVEDESPEVAGE